MRIASLVPSWTETLIECGADVVARTRFCVHPAAAVKGIPAVGGTKDVARDKLGVASPELLVLDREENPKSFTELGIAPWFASHVRSVEDVPRDLRALAALLEGDAGGVAANLTAVARRWDKVVAAPVREPRSWSDLPGVVEWWRPAPPGLTVADSRFRYLIWRGPYMAAGPGTFIGSVLAKLGFGAAQTPDAEPYPEVSFDDADPATAVALLSTEPYPFAAKREEAARELPGALALVDGESFSWFGTRSLRFLEAALFGA